MSTLFHYITSLSDFIWGYPLLILLIGGGILMSFTLGFFQIRYLPFILKETFGKIFSKPEGEGTITPFQAACSALASTVGAANIVGVPVAIATGGPGAVFWMWSVALIGQATKFSEIILGIHYREKNSEGEFVGGPYYYLKKGLNAPILGAMCSFFFMLEIIPSISTQTLSVCQTAETIGIPKHITGILVAILVGLVIFGGIKRIAKLTEKLVPIMASLFVIGTLLVVLINFKNIPHAFSLIFKGAFTPTAAIGGFSGAAIAATLKAGMARGTYSNEAGMGSAPIAHAAAVTDHPVRQAFWGVFGIIIDTMTICTMTALSVLTTDVWTKVSANNAASMPALVFQDTFGQILGGGFMSLSMLMFVLSTIIVIAFYCEKMAESLFGLKFAKFIRFVALGAIVYGSFGELENLFKILDFFLALVIIPNMIGVIGLRKTVKSLTNEFFSDPKYYPKASKNNKSKSA